MGYCHAFWLAGRAGGVIDIGKVILGYRGARCAEGVAFKFFAIHCRDSG